MTVRQCPRCPLRFAVENELRWHAREEHRSVPPSPRTASHLTAPAPAPAAVAPHCQRSHGGPATGTLTSIATPTRSPSSLPGPRPLASDATPSSASIRTASVPAGSTAPSSSSVVDDGTALLALRGDLRRSDGPRIARLLDEHVASGARIVYVDMAAVGYVDAAIARLLLITAWRLEKDRRRLLVVRADRRVRRMLQWAGADYLMDL